MEGWKEVTADHPCQACGKTDWCTVSPDGEAFACRRNDSGLERTDRGGAVYWLHGKLRPPEGEPHQQKLAPLKADADFCDEVYGALLELCELDPHDRDALRRRGLGDDHIGRNCYRSTPADRRGVAAKLYWRFGDKLLTVPGFIKSSRKGTEFITLAGAKGTFIPCRDPKGRIVGLNIRRDKVTAGGKYVWLSSAKHDGPSPGAPPHVPLGIKQCDLARVTEGLLKADVAFALSGLPTIALPGVASYRAALPILRSLDAKAVRIALDADYRENAHVARALCGLAQAAAAAGLAVEIEHWDAAQGKGIDDVLAAGHQPKVLTGEAVTTFLVGLGAEIEARDRVILGADYAANCRAAIRSLRLSQKLFIRAGRIVHVIEGMEPPKGLSRPKDSPRVAAASMPLIRAELSECATFERSTGEDMVPVSCPRDIAEGVMAAGVWPLRQISQVVETPALRADGTVLTAPGYDESTGLYFAPRATYTIPERVTRQDAVAARDVLLELVQDFPFQSPPHRSAYLAACLTPLARFAFDGPAPLFWIDKNVRGAGGSLLAHVLGCVSIGRPLTVMTTPTEEAEWRKRITSMLVAGEPVAYLDNVHGSLGSPSLDAALTTTSWSDRVLQKSETTGAMPCYMTWFASSNNAALSGDLARRVLQIRLETTEEQPENRQGFAIDDLRGYALRHHARLTEAALTILVGYCQAGRPQRPLEPWGSYEAWSDLIRQAIVWVHMPDAAETRIAIQAADRSTEILRSIIEGLEKADPGNQGMTVKEMTSTEGPLKDALVEAYGDRDGKLNARSVGMKLHHQRKRYIGGRCLERDGDKSIARWLIHYSESRTNCTNWTKSEVPTYVENFSMEEGKEIYGGSEPGSPVSPSSPVSSGYCIDGNGNVTRADEW